MASGSRNVNEWLADGMEVLVNGALTPGTSPASLGKAEDAPHASGDVGVELLGVRNDNGASSFVGANGDYSPIAVGLRGEVFTQSMPANNPFTPQAFILAAATNTQIASANAVRRGLMIVNRSGQEVFLRFGTTAASATVFSWVLASGEKYEVPFNITSPVQAFSTLAGASPGVLVQDFGTT